MRNSKAIVITLWTLQILLAALFLFAGVMKLVVPVAALEQQSGLPGALLRFIGAVEFLGALGLILPTLTRIKPELTPLAAAGLVIIMFGATWISIADGAGAAASFPAVVGVLLGFVVYGRMQTLPTTRLQQTV